MHGTFGRGKGNWCSEPPDTVTKGCFLSDRIDRSQVGDDLFAH